MMEEGWVYFYAAARDIENQLGVDWREARRLLRDAGGYELIRAMAAPDDDGILPLEFWERISPIEWRQREADYAGHDADGCKMVAMLKEDDFNDWLHQQVKRPQREAVITKLLKDGRPGKDLQWKPFRDKVRKVCNASPDTPGFSDVTITKVTRRIMADLK